MRSLWVDPSDQTYPTLDRNLTVDVAIVGGGFSGIGAAWELRDAGGSVALLESRTVASGASGRNAGFVLAGPAAAFHEAVRDFGPVTASEIWRLTRENNRTIANLIEDLGLDCGYARRGSMSLAGSEDEWVSMSLTHEALRSAGVESCLVPAEDLPRPFHRMYEGGLYYPGNGEMQPAAFVRGVARSLPSAVQIFEMSPVRTLRRAGSWELATGTVRVVAESVLLTTNAYTHDLLTEAPIAPTRGQVLSTEPLTTVVVPFPMYADRGYQYWRQTPEGRLVVGGWRNLHVADETGTDERLHDEIQSTLTGFAETVAGSDVRIEHRWAGIMGFTPDLAPLVGRVPGNEGLYVAAGYSGHGVSMAFTCGARAAAMAVDVRADIPTCFDPGRFASQAKIRGDS